MTKRKWHTKAIYAIVALAMTVGLLLVPAAVMQPSVVKAAMPAGAAISSICFVDASTNGDIHWSDDYAGLGDYSVLMNGGTQAGAQYAAVVWDLDGTMDLDEITEFIYNYYFVAAGTYGPHVCFYTHDSVDSQTAEITLEPSTLPCPAAAGWNTMTVVPATPDFFWFGTETGTAIAQGTGTLNTLATFQADAGFADHVIDRIQIEFGWWSGGTTGDTYLDDVSLNGTDIGLEVSLCPDIAYNVKTAEEEYRLYGFGDCETGIPMCDACPGLKDWRVFQGCGPGTVEVVDGGGLNTENNYIVVNLVTKGDCHITVDFDDDTSISLDAEKKWGEIYCTELDSEDSLVDDEYLVTESVEASFLWEDCVTETELPADDAVVDWWLMEIDALADVQALETALGDDPCDDDGGCGTYTEDDPAMFTYDTIVYKDPFEVLDAIQADNLVDLLESYIFESNGVIIANTDYTQNQTDVDGEATVGVHIESPTGVMLVTLTDYPINKHGENVVCVQHETWPPPPPPPTVEKFPLIAWVGEKTVVEWNLGTAYAGEIVTFASERPYSIGVLEDPYDVADIGDVVDVEVDCDGIARCIVHSDKSGKTNILAAVVETLIQGAPKQVVSEKIIQQGFIVYWIAIESVDLANIEDSDLPNPTWDTVGLTEETLDIGDSTTLRVRVRGYFVDPDPEFQSTRPVDVLDFDGDGVYDILLPAGRWVLPDDWNRLAGGALWELQKPHWDIMDDLDDPTCPVLSDTDANDDYDEEMGDYDDGWTPSCVNSPNGNAAYPVIGPFSTAQPCDADQWITDPAAVLADATVTGELRTTAVPDYRCDLFDAVIPPLMTYFVADSGTLGTVDKGDIYYGLYLGDRYFTFPYYRQEIPSSELFNPYYGEGPAGYRWDSWDNDPVNAPLAVKGPYDYYEPLPLWDYDYDAIEDIFGYGITAADEQLLLVYTDNHGEAYVEFTLEWIGESTINAIACYPFLVGDFNSVISNDVIKVAEDEKDIKVAWERIDDMTDMLYVFVRDYDGEPATEDLVDFNRDGVDGTIVDLLDGVTDTIAPDGSSALDVTTRVMTASEIVTFTDATISLPLDRFHRELDVSGALLFAADEDPADYAITGIEVISSLGEPVDIVIKIHDIFDGEWVEDFDDDQILYFGEEPSEDILDYYRGADDVVCTSELLTAIGDWADGIIPSGFTAALTTTELLILIVDWAS